MTALEKHYDFRLLSDEIEALANKSFEVAEIDWLLTRAQEQLVRNRINQNNVRRRGFEMDRKRIDDLKGILVKWPEQPDLTPTQHPEGVYEIDLSNLIHPYYFFVRATALSELNDCEQRVGLTEVQHDDLNESLSDPFNRPNKRKLLFNFGRSSDSEGSSMYIYCLPEQTVNNVRIEYLKKPRPIRVGGYEYLDGTVVQPSETDLDEHIHPEIVNHAVQLAVGIMKDPALYQTFQIETQFEE
jgi:hypothetical protein